MRARSRRPHHQAIWLVPVVAVALSGCGGSSALSKADLVKKADAICLKIVHELAAAGPQPADFNTNPASAASFLDKTVPVIHKGVSELTALKPASDVKSEWDAWTSALTQEDRLYQAMQAAAHAKQRSGIQDLAKIQNIRDSATHPAELQLGLTCHA